MGKQPLNIDAILATVSRPGDRSPLFCWLYQHHDELAEAMKGRRIIWRAFCALFIEVGLKDANGNTPTERTARETWYQVRREVSRQRAVRVTIQAMRSGPPDAVEGTRYMAASHRIRWSPGAPKLNSLPSCPCRGRGPSTGARHRNNRLREGGAPPPKAPRPNLLVTEGPNQWTDTRKPYPSRFLQHQRGDPRWLSVSAAGVLGEQPSWTFLFSGRARRGGSS